MKAVVREFTDMAEGQPYYWSIDFPGMTSEQVPLVASAVEKAGIDLQVIPVAPEGFLTLSLDRDTVEALMAGLAEAERGPVLDGAMEVMEDWLAWQRSSVVEPEK